MSPSRRQGNARAYHAGVRAAHNSRWEWRREPGVPVAKCRAGCAALPRTVPRTEPRHAKLSASATFHAAHRAVARRRDGDIVPYRNGARGWSTAAGHESGARARDTSVEYGEGHE